MEQLEQLHVGCLVDCTIDLDPETQRLHKLHLDSARCSASLQGFSQRGPHLPETDRGTLQIKAMISKSMSCL